MMGCYVKKQSLNERFALLEPNIQVFGPKDEAKRPALILFHGCGGLRDHVLLYAEIAAMKGIRAFVVDSFAPRGWGRSTATSLICTGLMFQGYERAGDVLAVLWGLSQRADVDQNQIMLMGESHGGWAIMDLMTLKLDRSGQAGISDPDPRLLDGVKGLFLVYPYINFPARTNINDWHYSPKTMVIAAKHDHLTPLFHTRQICKRLKSKGLPLDMIELNASHAFDEVENDGLIMQYNPDATKSALDALIGFLAEVFGSKADEKVSA